jgi:hypothetical protein
MCPQPKEPKSGMHGFMPSDGFEITGIRIVNCAGYAWRRDEHGNEYVTRWRTDKDGRLVEWGGGGKTNARTDL